MIHSIIINKVIVLPEILHNITVGVKGIKSAHHISIIDCAVNGVFRSFSWKMI